MDPVTVEAEVLDDFLNTQKLPTVEALYITKLKPRFNQKEEYRSRELMIKVELLKTCLPLPMF